MCTAFRSDSTTVASALMSLEQLPGFQTNKHELL